MAEAEIDILKEASRYADSPRYQTPELAYRHAIRDGTTGQTAREAGLKMAKFLQSQLEIAIGYEDQAAALWALGIGMHAIMDYFSGSHEGFQPWYGGSSVSEMMEKNGKGRMLLHFLKDSSCPWDRSNPWSRLNSATPMKHWMRSYLEAFRRAR